MQRCPKKDPHRHGHPEKAQPDLEHQLLEPVKLGPAGRKLPGRGYAGMIIVHIVVQPHVAERVLLNLGLGARVVPGRVDAGAPDVKRNKGGGPSEDTHSVHRRLCTPRGSRRTPEQRPRRRREDKQLKADEPVLSKEPPCPSELDLVKRERKLAAVCNISLELIKRDRVGRGVHGVRGHETDHDSVTHRHEVPSVCHKQSDRRYAGDGRDTTDDRRGVHDAVDSEHLGRARGAVGLDDRGRDLCARRRKGGRGGVREALPALRVGRDTVPGLPGARADDRFRARGEEHPHDEVGVPVRVVVDRGARRSDRPGDDRRRVCAAAHGTEAAGAPRGVQAHFSPVVAADRGLLGAPPDDLVDQRAGLARAAPAHRPPCIPVGQVAPAAEALRVARAEQLSKGARRQPKARHPKAVTEEQPDLDGHRHVEAVGRQQCVRGAGGGVVELRQAPPARRRQQRAFGLGSLARFDRHCHVRGRRGRWRRRRCPGAAVGAVRRAERRELLDCRVEYRRRCGRGRARWGCANGVEEGNLLPLDLVEVASPPGLRSVEPDEDRQALQALWVEAARRHAGAVCNRAHAQDQRWSTRGRTVGCHRLGNARLQDDEEDDDDAHGCLGRVN
eukprot:m.261745 g.261745  ORF g.261745 m.261745 type:complete len:615 (-) comp26673_c0_seq10:257-2101(-)